MYEYSLSNQYPKCDMNRIKDDFRIQHLDVQFLIEQVECNRLQLPHCVVCKSSSFASVV